MAFVPNRQLLDQIDQLKLRGRLSIWRQEVKKAPYAYYPDRQALFIESWKETEGEHIQIRRALAFKHICENQPISILPWELIVGKATPGIVGCQSEIDIVGDYIPSIWNDEEAIGMGWESKASMSMETKMMLREAVEMFRGKNAVDVIHDGQHALYGPYLDYITQGRLKDPDVDCAIFSGCDGSCDFPYIINYGVGDYIKRAKEYIELETAKQYPSVEKIYFWKASIICMEAIIAYAHRYADLAGQMAAEESDPTRKIELESIADACRNVPEKPATTLQEALTSMAIVACGKVFEAPTHNYPHWGRADQYLYPFFMDDLDRGSITLEDAYQMCGELLGRWGTSLMLQSEEMSESHQINWGINNIVLGGYTQTHEDGANELSCLFLHVAADLKLSSPTVNVRWTKKTPNWLMEKAIACNMETRGGIPLFENDESVVNHFVAAGVPYAEACEWIGLGCIYPTLPTRSEHYGMHGLGAFNLAAMLQCVLHHGKDINGNPSGPDCGDLANMTDAETIIGHLCDTFKYIFDRTVALARVAIDLEPTALRQPFMSTVAIPWHFANGRDLLFPDPEYSQWGFSLRAIIDCADSIMAIKKICFDDKVMTLEQLVAVLDANFECEGGEEVRQLCLACPKFGNDIPEVDQLAKEISDRTSAIVMTKDNSPYRPFMVANEGLSWHYYGGLGVQALPNGRKALEPLYDGSISPMGGGDTHGPTAVLRSVLNGCQKDAYSTALNQKFSSSILQTPSNRQALIDYTNAFFNAGGTHIQYNIVDTEELKDAQVHPENYSDLIVRVGGFSAYFTQLSEGIQGDVISRSENSL